MISKETRTAFFSLLGQALWPDEGFTLQSRTNDGWEEIRALSKRHSVQGIVFDAVRVLPRDCGMSPLMKAKWLSETVAMEQTYRDMAVLIDRQRKLWDSEGLSAVLLKGHSVASFYPVPEHRSCGDIDWWFPLESDWKRAGELAREKGMTLVYDSDGDCHYLAGGIVVEHHRKGYPFEGLEGELLYLNSHILRHAMVLGVGMKQLCDIAAAYTACYGKYDAGKLRNALERRGMLKWTNLLHSLLVKELGMPEQYLPFPLEKQKREADIETLVSLIIRDGHFGRSRRHRLLPVLERILFFVRYCPKGLFSLYGRLIAGRLSRRKYA